MGRLRFVAGLGGLAVMLALVVFIYHAFAPKLVFRSAEAVGIMGTDTHLTAVGEPNAAPRLEEALRSAEAALRGVEARMSVYLSASEVSRLNAAKAGQVVPLSPDTNELLVESRRLNLAKRGAFDVTCLPLFRLWAEAGKAGVLPGEAAVAAARAACGWDKFEWTPAGVRKRADGAGVGLGGIAKGWAIDRALEAMRQAGVRGGLVEVGGDVACFGLSPGGQRWRVGIRDPFEPRSNRFLGILLVGDAAVCTSGNYERYSEIGGRRYSHIIDPATGWPVDFAPSVTVVAPTCAAADAWATALSVLGPDGIALLPTAKGVEAMVVVGSPADHHIYQTPGFAEMLVAPIEGAMTAPRPTAAPATTASQP